MDFIFFVGSQSAVPTWMDEFDRIDRGQLFQAL